MKMQQFLTGTRAVLAALPLAGALLVGNTSAWGQAATAIAQPQSSMTIAIAGTVSSSTPATISTIAVGAPAAGSTEDVTFAKAGVKIDSTIARDPDFNKPPVVILNITFLKAAGVGATTKTKYIAEANVNKVRVLKGTDVIQITFPFSPDKPQGYVEARSGRATFTLNFDTNGVLTGATGTIDTPTFL